jgi:hypothetical protein
MKAAEIRLLLVAAALCSGCARPGVSVDVGPYRMTVPPGCEYKRFGPNTVIFMPRGQNRFQVAVHVYSTPLLSRREQQVMWSRVWREATLAAALQPGMEWEVKPYVTSKGHQLVGYARASGDPRGEHVMVEYYARIEEFVVDWTIKTREQCTEGDVARIRESIRSLTLRR